MPGWIRNGDWEQAGVFVVHVVKFNALIRSKVCQPKTPPMEEVVRYCQCDSWAAG
jgi:hypothetical protein